MTALAAPDSTVLTGLKGRSFLKELDFAPAEWMALIELAAQLKAAKKAGQEERRLAGRNIALLFEKTSTQHPLLLRGRLARPGSPRHLPGPVGLPDGPQGVRGGHRPGLGRMFDGIEYRGDKQSKVEELAALSGVPVWNGLTDEWHPTQMLCDSLTMLEHAGKPAGEISYAYVGDARFNMGRSLLVNGALLGADVRIVAPRSCGR